MKKRLLGTILVCPVCDFDFNHIVGIERVEGHDNYEAGWIGRGDLYIVTLQCEEGHEWQFCLGEHKGQVLGFARHKTNLKET